MTVSFVRAVKREETAGVYDRFEAENRAFHQRVREEFLAIARKEPDRVKVIDAVGSVEEVAQRVRSVCDELFKWDAPEIPWGHKAILLRMYYNKKLPAVLRLE